MHREPEPIFPIGGVAKLLDISDHIYSDIRTGMVSAHLENSGRTPRRVSGKW